MFASRSITSPWEGFWLAWRTVTLDHTSRSLTFEKDKLATIPGLASMIQHKTGAQYIAGMWNARFTIEYEPCWKLEEQGSVMEPRPGPVNPVPRREACHEP